MANQILRGVSILILLLVVGCSKPPAPLQPHEVALNNLYLEQVKSKTWSETWSGLKCIPTESASQEMTVCTARVFDEFGGVYQFEIERIVAVPSRTAIARGSVG